MNERVPSYLLHGLRATPVLLTALLEGVTAAQLDARPDPERFTLREVVCHLADWEAVCHARLKTTLTQDEPELPDWDEDQAAIDGRYSEADFPATLARFLAERAALLAFLQSCPASAWARTCTRMGRRSDFLGLVAIQLGHDGYHLQQVVEFRQ